MSTLPLVLFAVLFELAIGGAMLMWILDRTTEPPRGFLRLAGGVGAATSILGALVGGSLPSEARDLGRVSVVVTVLVALYFVTTLIGPRSLRGVVGGATSLAGLALLLYASGARPGGASFDVLVLLALPLGALALGGANAAMLLGHWYLVTPRLPPGPLQRAALVFFAAVALQAVAAALVVGRGDVSAAWLISPVAVGIRVGVGIAVPAVIALGAWWTAHLNTQSSTGLLYVALGMVLAGELSARVLFYLSGVPL